MPAESECIVHLDCAGEDTDHGERHWDEGAEFGWGVVSRRCRRDSFFSIELDKASKNLSAFAVVAPHAGWYFSGDLAAKAVWSLRDCDTVVILGGHLRRGDPLLFAEEGRFDCTVREAENDVQLLDALMSELKSVGIEEIAPDRDIDNSVEILLPLAALRFPQERFIWLRVPPDYKARELGSALTRAAVTCGKRLAIIASTDLTHYGPNYGFYATWDWGIRGSLGAR